MHFLSVFLIAKNGALAPLPVVSFVPLTAEMKMLIWCLGAVRWLPTAPEGRSNVEVRFDIATAVNVINKVSPLVNTAEPNVHRYICSYHCAI